MNEQLFIVVKFANCSVKYLFQLFSTIGFFINLYVLWGRFNGYSPSDTVFVYQLIPRCLPQTLSQNQLYFIFPVVCIPQCFDALSSSTDLNNFCKQKVFLKKFVRLHNQHSTDKIRITIKPIITYTGGYVKVWAHLVPVFRWALSK